MIGVHCTIRRCFAKATRAVFFDRDGVIVEETGYLHRPEDIRLIDGAAEAITRLAMEGWASVVVTNQAGIARGYYDWQAFERTQTCIEERLKPATFDGVWACGYHPEGIGILGTDHPFRKPNPGMILDAAARMNLDLAESWLIGDKSIDIQAAVEAHLAGAVLVRTGYGKTMEGEVGRMQFTHFEILVCDSVYEAVEQILRR